LKQKLTNLWKAPVKRLVSEWADEYRALVSDTSAEPGKWDTDRTPYMREPMDAFIDPYVSEIVIKASAQTGKTECLINCLMYSIDMDPGPMILVQPTVDAAEDFSKRRISSAFNACTQLKGKISESKSRDGKNTILKKAFAGGMLTIAGSNSPVGFRSIPSRYIFGDEIDAWPSNAGSEGDPMALLLKRSITFYNRKAVFTSTPTIKGKSRINDEYLRGTQETWQIECPNCDEYHFISLKDIHFEHDFKKINNKKIYEVKSIFWRCPDCGYEYDEYTMKRQPAKYVALNPDALKNQGIRSFWFNAFVSPFITWHKIILEFLEAHEDPEKLQVVYNTLLGELWEDRGDIDDEDTLLDRREVYPAELPKGVLVLTCGVDTQDNRLEYEVVGHGKHGETWGITQGQIMGRPDTEEVWRRLDDVIEHVYKFETGKGLMISLTCVDSGGHFTQEVYTACRNRQSKRVFAIKGKGGEGVPHTAPPTKIPIRENKNVTCWLYTIGVDAGKSIIMSSLKVQEPGPKYCHFPLGEDKGYDSAFFNGLLSEKLVLKRSGGRDKWAWEKIDGHARNEALDIRNYNLAAIRILNPDMDAVEKRMFEIKDAPKQEIKKQPEVNRVMRNEKLFDEW